VQVVVLPGDVEVVLVAAGTGELRGAGIGREVDHAVADEARDHGHGDVGEDDAGHDIHAVALDHALGDLHAALGLEAVVLDEELDAVAGPGHLDGEQEAVADILAEIATAGGQGGDHADLDRLGDGLPTDDRETGDPGQQSLLQHP
jgi:hypothetical protein